jgi:Ca2+-binding RTX toxin-like protein
VLAFAKRLYKLFSFDRNFKLINIMTNSVLADSLTQATTFLSQFATQPNFLAQLRVAFGNDFDQNIALGIKTQFQLGDFSLIPKLRVLTSGELGLANGAYAGDLDEIFVSSDFLAKADVAGVAGLLLEEIGHKLDRLLNGNVDSAGDEGDIFRLLATGQDLSAQTLAGLKAEDDHAAIVVDGQSVNVENQIFMGTDGNDTLIGTTESDTFSPLSGADRIDGVAGTDYLYIRNPDDIPATIVSYTNPTNGTITGGSNNGTTFKNIESLSVITGSGNDNINVSAATDEVYISSGVGNDTLIGGAGKNLFYPGTGADVINGGAGIDTLVIKEDFNNTTDINVNYTIPTNGTITGGSNNGTTFQNIERVQLTTGSGNNNINLSAATGGVLIESFGGNDTLTGGSGDDIFYPGVGGADVINGAAGIDYLQIRGDGFIDGYGYVDITVNYSDVTNGRVTGGSNNGTTFQNIEKVTYESAGGKANINLSAATGEVIILGASENDTLTGGAGNDTIVSGRGDDVLNGSSGADRLFGGLDNDTYVVDRILGGGTTIDDSPGPDYVPGYGSIGTNDKLILTGGVTLSTTDISRNRTTLLIDLNRDGIFDPKADLSIEKYFSYRTGSATDTGFIETLDTLSGSTVINLFKATRNDFNGDRKSDILWRNDFGSVALWQMNGATVTSGNLASVSNIDPSWKVTGTGDFNGDGKADILWRNTNGSIAVWAMDGSTVVSSALTSGQLPEQMTTTVMVNLIFSGAILMVLLPYGRWMVAPFDLVA